jgi:hypothetical protein
MNRPSTLNFQRSTLNFQQSDPLDVERWALNVERFPFFAVHGLDSHPKLEVFTSHEPTPSPLPGGVKGWVHGKCRVS